MACLPRGVPRGKFNQAIARFVRILGEENVIVDSDKLAPYAKIMLAVPNERHEPSGALVVENVEQIQAVMAICNQFRIPFWPISTGRNFGYGSAAPATPGQLVLDLRKMNKIIEVDPELGTALVEPGVTYVQLVEYLKAHDLPFWPSFPSSGGITGPMGNLLDRGIGFNRHGEHAANFAGMEVVLADGTVLRTGMGGVEGSTTWQSYRWGFGPWLDGLFMQSNFGVVTKIGIWLMKKPPAYKKFMVGLSDLEAAGRAVDVMRELRLQSILETGVLGHSMYALASKFRRSQIYQGEGAIPPEVFGNFLNQIGMPPWGVQAMLYGTPERIEADFSVVKEAFESIGGMVLWGAPLEGDMPGGHLFKNMIGEPNLEEFGIYNFRGGGGAMWLAPVVAPRAADVKRAYTLTDTIFRKWGFDFAGGFLVYARHTDMICDLLFDRTDPAETQRAYACFNECIDALAAEGYGIYRVGTAFMDKVAETYGPAQREINRRLKRALDPRGIIAPGKSGIDIR